MVKLQDRSLGCLPPESHAWMIGKNVETIEHVRELERILALTKETIRVETWRADMLEKEIQALKEGKFHMDDTVPGRFVVP